MIEARQVVFRCDADAKIGAGHLRRCLALATALQSRGLRCRFVARLQGCGSLPFPCIDPPPSWENDANFLLAQAADLLVLDHYGVNEAYQNRLYQQGQHWAQFISLPLRDRIWADWVITASPAAEAGIYQSHLQKTDTRLLLGPSYAVLRDEFIAAARQPHPMGPVRRIALSFGGGHDRGALSLCLKALQSWRQDIHLCVLTASSNPNAAALTEPQSNPRITVLVDAPDFAAQLAAADLAVIGGGMTAFEAACLGIPAIIIQVADDQATNSAAWESLGTAINLGKLDSVNADRLRACLDQLCDDEEQRMAMSAAGRRLVDGCGAERVAAALAARAKHRQL